jgi:hypothetical protein
MTKHAQAAGAGKTKPPAELTRLAAPWWLRLPVLLGLGLGLVSPVVLVWWQGFFSNDALAATNAAHEFLKALKQNDQEALRRLLTSEASRLAFTPSGLRGSEFLRGAPLDFEVEPASLVEGDKAQVRFTLRTEDSTDAPSFPQLPHLGQEPDPARLAAYLRQFNQWQAGQRAGQKGLLRLRKQDKQWRVYALTFPLQKNPLEPLSPGALLNWEDPSPQPSQAALDANLRQQEFRRLTAVDAQKFAASWRVDIDVQDRPAEEVLKTLCPQQWSHPLTLRSDAVKAALSKPVTLHIQGRPRLEAIHDVCRQVGLRPEHGFGMLHFRAVGEPFAVAESWPAVYVGPFQIQLVEEVQESPPHATGLLKLRIQAPELPAVVARLLSSQDRPPVVQVTAAGGRDLYHADNQLYFPTRRERSAVGMGSYEETWSLPLKNLLRDVDQIQEVRGRIRVPLPVRVEELRFDRLDPGSSQQAEEVRLTLRSSKPKSVDQPWSPPAVEAVLEFEGQGVESKQLYWMTLDSQGWPRETGSLSSKGSEPFRLQVKDETAAILFKVVTIQDEEYEFRLRDIPLRQRPPRQLEPPRFPSRDAPVTVEYVASPAGQAGTGSPVLRFTNHSQKDVQKVQVKWTWLDAAGQLLREEQALYPKPPLADFRPELSVLVKAQQVQQVSLLAAVGKAPEGTAKVTVTIQKVGFADGTTWSP